MEGLDQGIVPTILGRGRAGGEVGPSQPHPQGFGGSRATEGRAGQLSIVKKYFSMVE